MKIIYDDEFLNDHVLRGIGLGNFDGIHIGHQKLIKTLVDECEKNQLSSMVHTFLNHPDKILKNRELKLLTTIEKKIDLLNECQIDSLTFKIFDNEFANIEPKQFIVSLCEKYNMKLVVTGFNYRFGKDGKGDLRLLKELGEELGFMVISCPPVKYQDEIVSSTRIRENIQSGNMQDVSGMLGRFYSISGKVEYGNRIGTEIGFPTANIIPIKDYAIPSNGVYITKTSVDGVMYNSITNLGTKPTIDQKNKLIIETHIFDFTGWLYGKEIDVHFIEKLRDEIKYESIDALKRQIIEDIHQTQAYFNQDQDQL